MTVDLSSPLPAGPALRTTPLPKGQMPEPQRRPADLRITAEDGTGSRFVMPAAPPSWPRIYPGL
jgi:hypothetical protein